MVSQELALQREEPSLQGDRIGGPALCEAALVKRLRWWETALVLAQRKDPALRETALVGAEVVSQAE